MLPIDIKPSSSSFTLYRIQKILIHFRGNGLSNLIKYLAMSAARLNRIQDSFSSHFYAGI